MSFFSLDILFLICLTSSVFWISEIRKLFERWIQRRKEKIPGLLDSLVEM